MIRSIRAQLIAGSLLAVGVPMIALGVVLATVLWQFYLDQLGEELTAQASMIAEAATPHLVAPSANNRRMLFSMINRWRVNSRVRVTIVDGSGEILAATVGRDVGTRVTETSRPGFAGALRGRVTSAVWKNPRLGSQDTMYINMPVRARGRILGAVRVAYTLTQIQESVRRIRQTLLTAVTVYALLIVLLTMRLANSIVGPVEQLNRDARRIAAGEWDRPLVVTGAREIVDLAQSLRYLTMRLEQLEANRQQFVSNVSHELRTPLAAIRSMTDTLIEHGPTDPELAGKYLPRIAAQTDRLARLTSQLLDLAEIESGNLVAYPAPLALQEVVEDAVRTLGPLAQSREVELRMAVPSALPELQGDRDRLVQVFINLLDNAIRHTPAGGRVTVGARKAPTELVVTVADTGSGIAPEHLPRLFERFYRVDKARSRHLGGTGLGLSVVEQIVQAHGGSVGVDSAMGAGTTFVVKLPLAGPAMAWSP